MNCEILSDISTVDFHSDNHMDNFATEAKEYCNLLDSMSGMCS